MSSSATIPAIGVAICITLFGGCAALVATTEPVAETTSAPTTIETTIETTTTVPSDVTIPYGATPGNLTRPQRLHVTFDAASWGDGWGGDASVEWADAECLNMGGEPVWSTGETMTCIDTDY